MAANGSFPHIKAFMFANFKAPSFDGKKKQQQNAQFNGFPLSLFIEFMTKTNPHKKSLQSLTKDKKV